MTLTRTRTALELIKAQVVALNADPFVRSCFAQYLAVTFYSEMEERISEIISGRLQEYTNSPIGIFLTANMERIIRRTAKSDIVDLLGNFGQEFKNAFNAVVSDTDVSLYTNVITARHGVGHRRGSNITLSDIEYGVVAGDKILAALDSCFHSAQAKPQPTSTGSQLSA